MCAYHCLLLSSAEQKPSTLELRSEFDIKRSDRLCHFQGV